MEWALDCRSSELRVRFPSSPPNQDEISIVSLEKEELKAIELLGRLDWV